MILDTLYLLFKSNADDAIKGNRAVERSAKDTERALKNTNDRTKEVGENFVRMVEAGATALGTVAGFEILKTGVQTAVDFNTQLKLIGENAGVTAEQLRTAGIAAQLFGGSQDMGMSDAVAMARARRQGLIKGRDPREMMQNLREHMSVYPLDQQQNMLEQVYGLSQAGVRQASSLVSDEEFRQKWARAAQAAAGTNEAANKAYGVNASEVDLSEETKSFFNRLLEAVAPTLQSILQWLQHAVSGIGPIAGTAGIVGGSTLASYGVVRALKGAFGRGGAQAAQAAAEESAKVAGVAYDPAAFGGAWAASGGIGAGMLGAGSLALADLGLIAYQAPDRWRDAKAIAARLSAWLSSSGGAKKSLAASVRQSPSAEDALGMTLPTKGDRSAADLDVPTLQDLLNSPAALRDIDRARGISKSLGAARATLSAADAMSPATRPNITVRMDRVEVNAPQATDAAGIATGIAGALKNEILDAMGFIAANFDNGQNR